MAPEEIRTAVDRVVESDVFRGSPQLVSFLRFIVKAALSAHGVRVKSYVIGVEVFGRGKDFDPSLDPIVRVEATRLRRALERYYAGPGHDDPILIALPRGSYVPKIDRRNVESLSRPAPPPAPKLMSRQRIRGWAMTVAGFILVTAVIFIIEQLPRSALADRPDEAIPVAARKAIDVRPVGSLPSGNGMPTIYVEPLSAIGTPEGTDISANRLTGKLVDAFSRFDTINVAVSPALTLHAASDRPATDLPSVQAADYRLSGGVEYRGALTSIAFKLLDAPSGTIVWSRTFDHAGTDADGGDAEERIVAAVSNALLQSYGVIRSRDRARFLASDAGDPRYRCVLEAADAIRSAISNEAERARLCLEQLTSVDPTFAVGYVFLSLIYNRVFLQQVERSQTRDPLALDKALRAVRRAIELKPEDSRAYLALFVALFNQGDFEGAFAAAEKSMDLNKYDPLIKSEYGGRLIRIGDVERGLELLRNSGEHTAIRPDWHYFYLFLGDYLLGNTREAIRSAGFIISDHYAPGFLAKALAAFEAGDTERTQRALERLVKLQPGWLNDPRREISKLSPNPQIADRLLRAVLHAGLPHQLD